MALITYCFFSDIFMNWHQDCLKRVDQYFMQVSAEAV
ncbi:Hypothetical protein mma_2543 [Janthinobacterium sp. Marseille]|nr:Hypothetical protein mma_2543 [Janthinobacterium sp. Marseille]